MEKVFYILNSAKGISLQTERGELVSVNALLDMFTGRRVFAFYGQMGAGKTTFIKYICEQMGVEDVVNSPTFAIVNVYQCAEDTIYHFDCYRLKNLQEAMDLGAEEYLYSGQYCFIEWPDIIDPLLPQDYVSVRIEVLDDERRRCVVSAL